MKKIFQKVRMVGVVFCLLALPRVTMGQQIIITAGVDNLLYATSTDALAADTVYSSSYNGVGPNYEKGYLESKWWAYESLIWFDLSSIMGKKIIKAEIVLTPEVLAGDPVGAYDDIYYYIAVVADPWSGNTVTMNNEPEYYTGWKAPFNVPTSTVPIAIDVTYAITPMADGFSNYGFYLKDSSGYLDYTHLYATFFGSIERPGTTPPILIVDFEGEGDTGDGVAIVPSIIFPLLLQ